MAGKPYDYIAMRTIYYGGSRAYNTGDPVPAANVEKHDYEVGVDVAEYGTDAAKRVTGELTAEPPEPPAEPVAKQQPAVPKPTPAKAKRSSGDSDGKGDAEAPEPTG
ncbi:hypothetical protein [Actinomadura sp. GTD37]|uniref:hypothetical protein n=1 Tax=Actinomadura sp. GTD37 TaxID=1778030 RepID=UPI0035C1D5A3